METMIKVLTRNQILNNFLMINSSRSHQYNNKIPSPLLLTTILMSLRRTTMKHYSNEY
jgi:hypothetical protein